MLDIKFKVVKELEPILLKKYVLEGMQKATRHIVSDIKGKFGKGNTPKVRSGALRDSVKGKVGVHGDIISANFSSDLVYSAIQEYGGRITAKGKWLKFKIKNQFITVKSVTIPARPYLRPGIINNIENVKEYINDAVMEGCKQVKI